MPVSYTHLDVYKRQLFAHVQEDWFFTCAEGAVRLELSGAAIYRLGCFAGDGALRALGAAIHRARALPSPTCTGRLLDASLRAELELSLIHI